MPLPGELTVESAESDHDAGRAGMILRAVALQNAILNGAYFSIITTDAIRYRQLLAAIASVSAPT